MFDYLGVGALIVLVALFGLLTTRAWRAKNAILKWGGVVVSGLLTLAPLAVLAVALIGFYKLNAPQPNAAAAVKVAGTPEQIARGERLAHVCSGCHSPNASLPLTGQNFMGAEGGAPPVGTLYAPNLTPAGELKDWTDGEVIRAIREGVHKNGRALLIMPSAIFHNMSDDDVHALVAFLRSQPATGEASPPAQLNLLGALFIGSGMVPVAAQPPIAGPITAPAQGTTAEYGHYLVSIIGCAECHGENLTGRLPDPNGPPAGPNLTKVVPQWSEAEFITFFSSGQLPSGSPVGEAMPWKEVRAFATDEDLKAMYAYLHGLMPVEGSAQ